MAIYAIYFLKYIKCYLVFGNRSVILDIINRTGIVLQGPIINIYLVY